MATQAQIALGMVAQLRVLDPSISAEVGTPERKVIDTVAQALAENQIDLNVLTGAFDLDAKFADDLDSFISIFGFGRQSGALATGYVKFSRQTVSDYTIPIPRGTQVMAPSVGTDGTQTGNLISLLYSTTQYTEIPIGQLEAVVPIRAIQIGTIGNVAAGQITAFAQTPTLGVTAVTNEVPTIGGVDPETDPELKVRFKNTVFRNLAGTQDQFLAAAVSTQFTTKANVVGPISRYREYVQVPDVDDATADPDSSRLGNGSAGEWTSALSSIPYSQHVYDTVPYFVTNGDSGVAAVFYRRDTDFRLNTTNATRDKGDTYRGRFEGDPDVSTDTTTEFQPNLTFFNVYTGSSEAVQALRPKDVLLFEHSYMSSASRNDWIRQVLNCVDVFINGENPTLADAVVPKPSGTVNLFSSDSSHKFYTENFRRVGEPTRRPVLGNVFTGLFWEPVTDVPDVIETEDGTFLKEVHYWPIEDVSEIGGSVRSRGGIEWNPTVPSQGSSDELEGPYTGPRITELADDAVSVLGYLYDRNIVDLQTSLEGNKQVTTDVLAHRSTPRYFKMDVTAMYAPGSSVTSVHEQIRLNLLDFFESQYFGTVIQLSDILQIIHNTGGVDNVRWSKDILDAQSLSVDTAGNSRNRIVECDGEGSPLLNVRLDRRVYGTDSVTEVQQMYITGAPTGGTYKLKYLTQTTTALAWNAAGATISAALTAATIPATITAGTGTSTDPWVLTFSGNGFRDPITVTESVLTGGSTVFNRDFFLRDEELPGLPSGTISGDTIGGLIVRSRAQNTWNQL